jgi:L-threonate 2-dehydrogenase
MLVNAGGTSALSLAEAAKGADALLVVVVDAAQTDAVLFGNNDTTHEMKHGGVIVFCNHGAR